VFGAKWLQENSFVLPAKIAFPTFIFFESVSAAFGIKVILNESFYNPADPGSRDKKIERRRNRNCRMERKKRINAVRID
jgi:hypothetical protein